MRQLKDFVEMCKLTNCSSDAEYSSYVKRRNLEEAKSNTLDPMAYERSEPIAETFLGNRMSKSTTAWWIMWMKINQEDGWSGFTGLLYPGKTIPQMEQTNTLTNCER